MTEEYKVEVLDLEGLILVFKNFPEENIGFAFTGRPFPVWVHVIRNSGRVTVREME